jgi:Tol biopolymer transport system component/DNA-binding winged helix-turn-helix (wHTH) protein
VAPIDREGERRDELWIGKILVQPQLNRLSRGATEVKLEPKVMEILTVLAASAGSPLSRAELLAAVWPGVHVSDDALHRAIWKLRQALDEVAQASALLETIPKRGYRLAASVEPTGATSVVSKWALATAAVAVAVAALLVPVLREDSDPLEEAPPARPAPRPRFEPLTSLRGYESTPSLSPDGSRAVFHHFHKDGERSGRTDLYLVATSGGEPQRVETGEGDAMQAAWSPIDDRIAYVTRGEDGCRLRILSLSGAETVELGDCGTEEDPEAFWFPSLAWSVDARELFVSRRALAGQPARIYAIDLLDGGERSISDPPLQALGDSAPAASPNGEWLALTRRRADDVEDLYLVSLLDGHEQRLTQDHQPLAGIAWTPDSRELLFSSSRAGTFRLWSLPVTGGPAVPLDTIGMNATSPSLSPRGDLLVYEEWKSEINIWKADAAERNPLVASTLWDWRPQLSPDGAQIAFLSNREGSTELWVGPADGSSARRLTQIGVHFATVPRWSPDGRRLLFAAPRAGDFDVWTVDLVTGEVERLTHDASQERAPTWSADGGSVYFASDRAGAFDIWRMPAAGGAADRVTTGGGRVLLESPNGSRYLVKEGQPGIWRLEAGGDRLVVPGFPSSHWMNVALGGEALYFTRSAPDWSVELQRLAPGDAIETVRPLDGPGPNDGEWFNLSGLSVSADGSQVLWASVDHSDSDLWIARYGDSQPVS